MNYMKVENDEWTDPEIPSFDLPDYNDNCPFFSVTGDSLYFLSTRPGGFVFMTMKDNDEWTDPVALQIPIGPDTFIGNQFTMNSDKDVYFEIWENGNCDLYCSRYINDVYQTPEILPSEINADGFEFAAYIDPDDNFILFSSNRPGGYGLNDIYYNVKDEAGNWTDSINLGPEINSSHEEAFAFITYDNLYFFFTAQRSGDLNYNPYWVDAQIIFDLVTDVNRNEIPSSPNIKLSNYPNPFNPSTTFSFETTNLKESTQIEIYNLKGQKIKQYSIFNNQSSITWNGTDKSNNSVASGIYYYKLNIPNSPVKKMILLK